MSSIIRNAEPADYLRVTAVVDEWWGGRQMAAMLPKLFFVHFRDTSFVAEDEDGDLAGFLCGFRSQTFPDEAYVHFVGVNPGIRGGGLGRELYARFCAAVSPRTIVRAVTSPINQRSVAFHQAIGFEVERIDEHYDGTDQARVLMVKRLGDSS
jgi:ribosomal protein S18 acetylase RimI-like enzyme